MRLRELEAQDPDAALMLRLQQGDTRAFQSLYERYKKKLVTYCFRFTGNRERAEELAQDALIRVYRAAPDYRPEARFSTWIFKIATNVCLKEMKKKEYQAIKIPLDPAPDPEGGASLREIADTQSPMPDAAFAAREEVHKLEQALDTLPHHQKAALLLQTQEGFSYAEIGRQIGKSESSVKSLIHRARQEMARLLRPKT